MRKLSHFIQTKFLEHCIAYYSAELEGILLVYIQYMMIKSMYAISICLSVLWFIKKEANGCLSPEIGTNIFSDQFTSTDFIYKRRADPCRSRPQ